MAGRGRAPITLTDAERDRLGRVVRDPRAPQKHVWRARIIIGPGSGCGVAETMRRTGMSKPTVGRWRDRFRAEGVDGLLRDRTRPPGRRPIPEDRVRAPIGLAMSPPPPHAGHWTLRALAARMGMVVSTVGNILRRHRLQPHRVGMFKVSRDPAFERRIRDVVGLHVNPPDHAVVLSIVSG